LLLKQALSLAPDRAKNWRALAGFAANRAASRNGALIFPSASSGGKRRSAQSDSDSSSPALYSAFAARRVERAEGPPWPESGEGRLLILAGLKGPVFLVTSNFDVIKTYNNSSAYALSVSLGQIPGQRGRPSWPGLTRPPTRFAAANGRKA
jgi:hypothetical protein